jgi:segregation and condensation protein A
MSYQVAIEQFQGPLDVLLELIEQEKLEITDISLAQIAETFIRHLQQVEERYPEELADFLIVATRLLYLKSRALLPYLEADPDEMTGTQLADHLKMYKEFRDASNVLTEWLQRQQFSVARPVTTWQLQAVEFSPPTNASADRLAEVYGDVIDRVEMVIKIPKAAIRKAITLKEKIAALTDVLKTHAELSFHSLLSQQTDKVEIVVTFLAILELIKQNTVVVNQSHKYSDITIKRA